MDSALMTIKKSSEFGTGDRDEFGTTDRDAVGTEAGRRWTLNKAS
jgi:hypothetical protein